VVSNQRPFRFSNILRTLAQPDFSVSLDRNKARSSTS
jgi:hypothetical protein